MPLEKANNNTILPGTVLYYKVLCYTMRYCTILSNTLLPTLGTVLHYQVLGLGHFWEIFRRKLFFWLTSLTDEDLYNTMYTTQ